MGRVEGGRGKAKEARPVNPRSSGSLALGFILLALGLPACNTPNRATTGDPLFGSPPPRKTAEGPATPGAAVTVLPPVATPNNGTSTAALASGQPRQYDPDKDLRIASQGTNAGIQGWAGPTNPTQPVTGATLHGPEPVVTPATQPAAIPVNNSVIPAGDRLNAFEQAQSKLKARGALWQRLEVSGTDDNWSFACSVPNRQDPKKHRTYEAHARDYVAAMQAVIDQIDKDQ